LHSRHVRQRPLRRDLLLFQFPGQGLEIFLELAGNGRFAQLGRLFDLPGQILEPSGGLLLRFHGNRLDALPLLFPLFAGEQIELRHEPPHEKDGGQSGSAPMDVLPEIGAKDPLRLNPRGVLRCVAHDGLFRFGPRDADEQGGGEAFLETELGVGPEGRVEKADRSQNGPRQKQRATPRRNPTPGLLQADGQREETADDEEDE